MAKKSHPLAQGVAGYPQQLQSFATYNSKYGSVAPKAFVTDVDGSYPIPFDGKANPRVAVVPSNYGSDGITAIHYNQDKNYNINQQDVVAGNPSVTSPFRPTYQLIAPTVYLNNKLVQVGSRVSQVSVLSGPPVFNPAGPAQSYNIKGVN